MRQNDPSLTLRYYFGNTGTMTKHTTITFKCDAEMNRLLIVKLKDEGKTVSGWCDIEFMQAVVKMGLGVLTRS
jgi:hypothetical protein